MRAARLLAAFAFSLAASAYAADAAGARPNIVLFLVDDMGWMDSTPYGSRYYETPHMERFAKTALRFTDAYACPLCSPTRASILSGQYSARHGVTSASGHQAPQPEDAVLLPERAPANQQLILPQSRNYLRATQYTLAEALHDAGYRTAHIGKWHLGLTEPYWPEQQGFDVAIHGAPDPGPPSYFSPYGYRKFQSFPDGPQGEYITDRLTDEAVAFLEQNRDRPFFLNLWHHGVHGPWGHKEAYTREFANKTDPRGEQGNPIMASMLRSIDESLGRVLDTLDRLQLTEQTVVIFYSDNGGNTHSNKPDDRKRANVKPGHPKYAQLEEWRKWAGDRPPTNNAPLREGKGRIYEGGIRVPLMIRWPGVTAAGATSDAVVGPIDLYPTVLDILGLPRPARQVIDGVSIAPVLRGGGLEREAYFTWFPHQAPAAAVRQGDWKLIRRFQPTPEYPDGFELFNLRDDLSETHNLASAMPEKVRELDRLIDRFIAETGALAPKANPAYVEGASPRRGIPAASKALLGWVPKSCTARIEGESLVVEPEGKAPFLANVRVKHMGPLELRAKVGSASEGTGRVQWRSGEQESFPATGQKVDYTVAGGAAREVSIPLPVEGELAHLRFYVPAKSGEVALDWIELWTAGGEPRRLQRWDFGKSQ